MVKWKKGGAGLEVWLDDRHSVSVRRRIHDGLWLWWCDDMREDDSTANGYASTKAQAQACAIAVATALGWLKAEARPERVMVEEWWEVRKESEVVPGFRSSLRFKSASDAKAHLAGSSFRGGRIVHVRRYKR